MRLRGSISNRRSSTHSTRCHTGACHLPFASSSIAGGGDRASKARVAGSCAQRDAAGGRRPRKETFVSNSTQERSSAVGLYQTLDTKAAAGGAAPPKKGSSISCKQAVLCCTNMQQRAVLGVWCNATHTQTSCMERGTRQRHCVHTFVSTASTYMCTSRRQLHQCSWRRELRCRPHQGCPCTQLRQQNMRQTPSTRLRLCKQQSGWCQQAQACSRCCKLSCKPCRA
jgi:hypothetical protein